MNRRVISGFSKTEQALCLYFLHRKLKGNSTTFTLGQKKLVKIIGRHENSISRALNSLERKGWITREKVGKQFHLTFSPPIRILQQLICFCSKNAMYSLASENKKEELVKINATLREERDELRAELEKRLDQRKKNEEIASQITDEQLGSFVDDFLKKVNDNFDKRTLEEKLVASILTFQVKLGIREAADAPKEAMEAKDPIPAFTAWNSGSVKEAINLLKAGKE